MTLGLKIKFKRLEQGKTQAQLRKEAGVGIGVITSLEKGQIDNLTVKTLKKVAKALNTTVQELFFSDEEENKQN